MLKKTVTYENVDGQEVTETFYFNLSKDEVFELKLDLETGLEETIKRMIASEDVKAMYKEFKRILIMTHGERVEVNGRPVFRKTDETREIFEGSGALGAVAWEIMEGGEEAVAAFIRGVLPREVSRDLDAATLQELSAQPKPEENVLPAPTPPSE